MGDRRAWASPVDHLGSAGNTRPLSPISSGSPANCLCAREATERRPAPGIARAECDDGLYLVEVGATAADDALAGHEPAGRIERPRPVELVPEWASPRLVDVDASGSTIVVAVDRRPPLLASHDAGRTWSERGSGLPRGRAVAVGENPDDVLFAARNRLYVSRDGGVFWRALGVELPEIRDAAWG
jgi:hypothetical protein